MLSVSSINGAALAILQQSSTALGSGTGESKQKDILQVANGVSSEPSSATKSASAVAAKFAVDTAAAAGKIVVAGLGSADSWEELEELVRNNDAFSDNEKDEWLRKLTEMQEMETSLVAAIEEFKSSDAYALMLSGSLQSQLGSPSEANLDMSDVYAALNNLNERHGRSGGFFEF